MIAITSVLTTLNIRIDFGVGVIEKTYPVMSHEILK